MILVRYFIICAVLFLPLFLKAQKLQVNQDPLLFGQDLATQFQERGMPQLGMDFEQTWKGKNRDRAEERTD